ncbi:MAG: DUF2065 domain-containing protein [Geminicoccaceae bacterium]
MQDLSTALALVLVIEGLLWALFPDGMKRALAAAMVTDTQVLRWGGLFFVALGVVSVWFIRG